MHGYGKVHNECWLYPSVAKGLLLHGYEQLLTWMALRP
jgi:hypothetical protein